MSYIQSASINGVAASVTIAPIDTTSGHLLVAMAVRTSTTPWSGSPVTDNYGNVWQQSWYDGNSGSLTGSGALYYAENCVGGAGHTVTLTLPSGSEGIALAVAEFSSIVLSGSLGNTAHSSNASGLAVPPVVLGNLSGVLAGQLLIGSASVSHINKPPASLGLFTNFYQAGNGSVEGIVASYAIVDAIDTYYYEYTTINAGHNESYGLATFKGTGIALVHSTGVNAASVASVTSPAISTTSGNFLVVVCALFNKSFSGSPVTDSYGNTWTLAWQLNGGATGHAACYYVENCVGGAGHTVTLTPPGGMTSARLDSEEFSGIDLSGAIDRTITGSGSASSHNTGMAAATSQAEELLIGGGSVSSGGAFGYPTVPFGWITVESLTASIPTLAYEGVILAYQIAPSDGTYEYGVYTGSSGTGAWEAVGVALFLALLELTCDDPDGRVGDAYSGALIATGGLPPYGPYAVIAGTLPPGLSLNASTGAITGTPTLEGVYPFTGQVTDDNGDTAICACVITILHVRSAG